MQQDKINFEDILVKLIYLNTATTELFVKEAERILNRKGLGLRHQFKRRHNMIISTVKTLKNLVGSAYDDANVLDGENYDALQYDSNYMARLQLLLCDRLNGSPSNYELVEKFLKDLPQMNIVDEKDVEKFKLK